MGAGEILAPRFLCNGKPPVFGPMEATTVSYGRPRKRAPPSSRTNEKEESVVSEVVLRKTVPEAPLVWETRPQPNNKLKGT